MDRIRVTLNFPPDHPISKIDPDNGNRNKWAKNLIELGLNYQKNLEKMKLDIEDIKKMLQNGAAPAQHVPPTTPSKKVQDADLDLIMSIVKGQN